jgi:FKBP-type peptidyl-prolyl cis-trans isomerase FkpA
MIFSVFLLPALLFAQAPTPAPKAPPKSVAPKPAGTPATGAAKPAAAAPKAASSAKPGAPKAAPAKPVAGAKPTPGAKLTTDDEKIIYSLGLSVAKSLAQFDLTPAELNILKQAITDSSSGKPALDINEWGPKIQGLAQARGTKVAEREKAVARAFVAKIASAPGAVSSESGLVYIEQTAGTGKSPQATDTVTVHYRGTLTNGTEFDSSYKRNQTASFALNGVIKCWTEGVQKMKEGGKAKLVCPSNIAYGDQGRPPTIPGGATLIFEIELMKVGQ